MRRRLSIGSVLLAFPILLVLAGTAWSAGTLTRGQHASKIQIYVLQPAPSDPYPREDAGIRAEAKKFPNVTVTIDHGTAQTDSATMINKINDAVTRGVNVIALNTGAVGPQLVPALKAAISAGVKVMTFDQTSPVPGLSGYVQWDSSKAGTIAGTYFRKMNPAGGEIGMITAFKGNALLDSINNGFLNAIKGSKLKVVSTIDTAGDANKSRSATEDILTAHPSIVAMFVDNDLATVGVRQALQAAKKHIFMEGVFGTPQAYASIASHGYQSATVACPFQAIGKLALKEAAALGEGKSIPKLAKLPSLLITPANAAHATQAIEALVK